jgi:hypothetical protein
MILIAFIFTARPVMAQELSIMGGLAESLDSGHISSSWQLEYRQGLGEHLDAGLSYVNEGHIPNHHRDGGALQFWAQTRALDKHLSLAAGLGPYYFFDTTNKTLAGPSQNDHGWAGILSLAATFYTESRWLFQLRTNWIGIGSDVDRLSAVAGIGYQLEDTATKPGFRDSVANPDAKNELTVFLGQTVTNTFSTSQDVATSIEYRRRLARHIEWTAAWLYEVDDRIIRRNGLTTQLWAVQPFFDDSFSIGVGGGGYFAVEHYDDLIYGKNTDRVLSGIVAFTASYRFQPHWDIRTSWNRIITKYHMDTDVIMGGVGFRF